MIEKDKIKTPNIHCDKETLLQLELMAKIDPELLNNKCFRIQISSKGCDGFKYEFGITEVLKEDITVQVSEKVTIHMQPFCAFYLQTGLLSYEIDPQTNQDGFKVTNLDQEKFQGKFWKENEDLIPPQASEEIK